LIGAVLPDRGRDTLEDHMGSDGISALAQALREAFRQKNARMLLALSHPDASASSLVLNYRHNEELMGREFTVSDYRVSDYHAHPSVVASDRKQSWDIVPQPTHVVEFVLEYPDGRKRDMFYRCAAHNGEFVVSCFRSKDDRRLPSSETIDMGGLFADMRQQFRKELEYITKVLKTQAVGYFDIEYAVGWAPATIGLSAQTEELLLDGSHRRKNTYARYLPTAFIHQSYRDLLSGCRELIAHDGSRVRVETESLRRTYPDWECELRFRDALKRCLAAALAHELSDDSLQFRWLGRKVVRIASYDDSGKATRPLGELLTVGDIVVYSPTKTEH
jgi:hypothetical protein